MRASLLVASAGFVLSACGGGAKKVAKPPKPAPQAVAKPPKPETEEDRQAKRLASAHEIVPEGVSCLPASLKEDGAPRLELAAAGPAALLCAVDQDRSRLLGPVGCWQIDLLKGELAYKAPEPLPGRGMTVRVDGRCARGYCLPEQAKLVEEVVHMALDLDGKRVAVLAGDDVHLFDAVSKQHQSSFSIRGDKGVSNNPAAVHFTGEAVIVEGADEGPYSAVWVFKADGTSAGPVLGMGGKEEKPISTYGGSVSLLDKAHLGVAERGMEALTTYELETGKRSKIIRKLPKLSCKPTEVDAYWHGGDKVSDRCRESIQKASGHLEGATAVAGAKNLLVLLRGERLGELAVLDAKTLGEKKAIKLPWCPAAGAVPADAAAPVAGAAPAAGGAPAGGGAPAASAPAGTTQGGAPAPGGAAKPAPPPPAGGAKKSSDPDEGGD